jgi:hypothetical protein
MESTNKCPTCRQPITGFEVGEFENEYTPATVEIDSEEEDEEEEEKDGVTCSVTTTYVESKDIVVRSDPAEAAAAVGSLAGCIVGGMLGGPLVSALGVVVGSVVAHGVATFLKHLSKWVGRGGEVSKWEISQQIDILEDRLYDIPVKNAKATPAQRYELRTHWCKLLRSFRFSTSQGNRMMELKRALERRIPGLRLEGTPELRWWWESRSKT